MMAKFEKCKIPDILYPMLGILDTRLSSVVDSKVTKFLAQDATLAIILDVEDYANTHTKLQDIQQQLDALDFKILDILYAVLVNSHNHMRKKTGPYYNCTWILRYITFLLHC